MSYQPAPYEVDLRAWLARCVPEGVTVIYARQSAPRPSGQYVTLGPARLRMVGTPDGRVLDVETEPGLYQGQRRFNYVGTADVNIFAADARELARSLAESAWMPAEIEASEGASVSVQGVGQLDDLAAVLGAEWEGRAMLEVSFAFASINAYDAEAVETADATPEVG